MATLIRIPGGSGSVRASNGNETPAGYMMKAVALGDTFPGFGANVIPLCINAAASAHCSGGGGFMTISASASGTAALAYNGRNAVTAYVKSNMSCDYEATGGSSATRSYCGGTCSMTASNIWLPDLFDYDFTAIQNSVTSGTVTVWLEKS